MPTEVLADVGVRVVNRAGMDVAVRAVLREGSLSTAALRGRLEGKGWHEIADDELADALKSVGAWLSPDGEWLLQQPRRARPRVSTVLADELGVDPKELEGTPAAMSGSAGQAVREVRGPLPQSWRTVCAQMRDALSAELAAAKASSRDQDVSLGDGRVVARTGRRLVYAFAVRGSIDAADGTRCRLRLDTTWYDCEIVASSGSSVRLAVPRHAPDDETEALLRLDATFLLTEQIRYLDGIAASEGPHFDVQAALALTRQVASTIRAAARHPDKQAAPEPAVGGLNREQAEAVRRARQGGVSWIWGPPGTGKTTTVAAIVRALITDGLRVLVVSNTNTALDTALERFLADQGGQPRPGSVVRIGTPAHEQLSQYRPWPVLLDEEAARTGSTVAEAKVAIEQAIAQLRRTRAGIRKEKKKQKEWLDSAPSRLCEAQELVRRLERQLRDASVDRATTAVRLAEERLAHAQAASLSRSELAIRQRDVAAAVRRARLAPDVCRGLQADHARAVDAAAALKADLQQGRLRLPGLERALSAVDADLAENQAEAHRLDRLLTYVRRRVLDDADAVFATVHRCYLADLTGCRFDVVVIDEASMVAIPLALFAAGLGRGHTIVAGDFRQLGPITKTDPASSAAEWMGRSVFELAGIDQAVSAGSCVPTLTTLRQQHRMRPGIADLVGSGFYREAGLVTSPRVLDRVVPAALARCLPAGDVFLVDTTSAHSWMARAGGLVSRYNPIHALVVDALIRWIEEVDADVETGIGVIAPFAPQARLIHGLLADHESPADTGTVHRYQGGERDVIIYDTTEAPARGIGPHPWFTGSDGEDAGARLLNVALSRARDRLIVIADLNRLAPAASAGTPAAQTLAALFRQATRLRWSELLETGTAGITRLNGSAATPRLAQAITGATHRVVVWTSATGHPTSTGSRVEEALAEAARRGVNVTLWLPPAALPRLWPLLADTAAAVHPLEPVRENVAVVDDQIFVSSGDLLAGHPDDLTLAHRGPHASQALLNLLRRRPTKQAAGDNQRPRLCPRCGIPLVRIERWDKQVWARCHRCQAAPTASPVRATASDQMPQHPPSPIERLPHPRTAPTVCPSCGQLPTATARCSCSSPGRRDPGAPPRPTRYSVLKESSTATEACDPLRAEASPGRGSEDPELVDVK